MSERRFPRIKTKSVDDILQWNATEVSKLEGTDATPEDRKKIDAITEKVDTELTKIQAIQEELLTHMEQKGCEVWKHL